MNNILNRLGQPIGRSVEGTEPSKFPTHTMFEGRVCRIDPVQDDRHAKDLFEAYGRDVENKMWTYMTYGPFQNIADMRRWLSQAASYSDPQFYALVDKVSNRALGLSSYMRIKPEHGSIEIGGISFAPCLQRRLPKLSI